MGNHSMKNCWVMKVLRAITFIAAVLPRHVLSEEQSCGCKALSLCRGSRSVTRKLPAGLDESTIQSALNSAHVNQHTSSSLATGASQGHHYHSHMRNVDKDLHEIAEKLRGLSSLDSTIGNVVGNDVIGIDATNSDAIRSTCPWLNDRKPVCTSPGSASACASGWHQLSQRCFYISRSDETVSSFTAGEAACISKNSQAHLASIHSYTELNFIRRNSPHQKIWIGASDEGQEGSWFWSDGSPWDYEKWGSGEPNNIAGKENCGLIWNGDQINDGYCKRTEAVG